MPTRELATAMVTASGIAESAKLLMVIASGFSMSTVVGSGAATYSDDSAPSLVAREISDSKAASVAAPAALPFPHTMQVWGYTVWGCRTSAVMRYLKGSTSLAYARARRLSTLAFAH